MYLLQVDEGLMYRFEMSLTAVVAAVRDMFKSGAKHITITIDDYGGSGDEAWRRGSFAGYTKDNKIVFVGK